MSPRFTSPPDPRAYNAAVWAIVRQIPPGMVCTYGRVAALVPLLASAKLGAQQTAPPVRTIEPRFTRRKVITALAMARNKRDSNPPKKHGNIPL